MNLIAPVKSIMTTQVHTVNPEDSLKSVNDLFEKHNIHHIPVVRHNTIVGIISKSDFLHFQHGFIENKEDRFLYQNRLQRWKAKEIMTTKMAVVQSSERINVVIDMFLRNWFHAIPVVDNNELVGIVTTYDILKAISKEPIKLEDYS